MTFDLAALKRQARQHDLARVQAAKDSLALRPSAAPASQAQRSPARWLEVTLGAALDGPYATRDHDQAWQLLARCQTPCAHYQGDSCALKGPPDCLTRRRREFLDYLTLKGPECGKFIHRDAAMVHLSGAVSPPFGQELAITTVYFNPVGYQTRRDNFRLFVNAAISQGADLWVLECGTPGQWEVEPRPGVNVIRMGWGDSLWQKERLLNILIDQLPPQYGYVAWVDGDVLFDNPDWVQDTRSALVRHHVAQLFEQSVWLSPALVPEKWPSGSIYRPSVPAECNRTGQHVSFGQAHPGYAWAIRRQTWLEIGGLYDRHIMGSGDTIMVLGFYGWQDHPYIGHFGGSFRHAAELWIAHAGRIVQGDVAPVPGVLRHLWHGTREDRQYDSRLIRSNMDRFDPDAHLAMDQDGLWAWTAATPDEVKHAVNQYFYTRREDGPNSPPPPAN